LIKSRALAEVGPEGATSRDKDLPMTKTATPEMKPAAASRLSTAAAGRLISLDALRGFDMLWIIGLDQVLRGVAHASRRRWLDLIPGKL